MDTNITEPAAGPITFQEYREAFLNLAGGGLMREETERDIATLRRASALAAWFAVGCVEAVFRPDAKAETFPYSDWCSAGESLGIHIHGEEVQFGFALGWLMASRANFTEEPGGPLPDGMIKAIGTMLDDGLAGALQAEFHITPVVAHGEQEFDGITLASLRELGLRVQERHDNAVLARVVINVGCALRLSLVEPRLYPALRDAMQQLLQDTLPGDAADVMS